MSTPFNRTIQDIVIHHMGDGKPPEVSILQRWNPSNYDYPEYDFGVEADGTIRIGRPLNYQGAHTLSDKPPYSQKGNQWWNQNSIGIGIAGDFTKYPMPQVQFNALVALVKRFNVSVWVNPRQRVSTRSGDVYRAALGVLIASYLTQKVYGPMMSLKKRYQVVLQQSYKEWLKWIR